MMVLPRLPCGNGLGTRSMCEDMGAIGAGFLGVGDRVFDLFQRYPETETAGSLH